MDNTKHTPGPWRVYHGTRGTIIEADGGACDDGSPLGILCPGTGGARSWTHTIAELGWSGIAEWEANACLIAAAPDMLEALKMAQLWLDYDGRYDMQKINAAIAKAEGRD